MRNFLKHLLSKSNEASIRRFIALMLVFPYIYGVFIGLVLALRSTNENVYIATMIFAGLPIFLAFFMLTWQHVVELKNSNPLTNIDENINEQDEQQL